MNIPRLYISNPLEAGSELALEGKPAHYLSRVLRLGRDDEIIVFNGDGFDYRCILVDFSHAGVTARIGERRHNNTASPLAITLVQAMSRGDRMDYTLQKATELGVGAVQLLLSERVELKLSGKRLEKRLGHWRGVIQSACEQCGRATLPGLIEPVSIGEWLDSPGQKLVLDAGGGAKLSQLKVQSRVDIAVGPEGGFSDGEIEQMVRQGVQAVQIGPRILRTETAGPAAIAVLQSIAGDMK